MKNIIKFFKIDIQDWESDAEFDYIEKLLNKKQIKPVLSNVDRMDIDEQIYMYRTDRKDIFSLLSDNNIMYKEFELMDVVDVVMNGQGLNLTDIHIVPYYNYIQCYIEQAKEFYFDRKIQLKMWGKDSIETIKSICKEVGESLFEDVIDYIFKEDYPHLTEQEREAYKEMIPKLEFEWI